MFRRSSAYKKYGQMDRLADPIYPQSNFVEGGYYKVLFLRQIIMSLYNETYCRMNEKGSICFFCQ